MRTPCPLCGTVEYAELDATEVDERPFVVCTGPHHPEPLVYEPINDPNNAGGSDELGEQLDIWDTLLDCVPEDAGAVSFGVVEDRLFARHPDTASALLLRYGHRFRDPEHHSHRYTMSTYLEARLGELARDGRLALSWGLASGPWGDAGVISHWERA